MPLDYPGMLALTSMVLVGLAAVWARLLQPPNDEPRYGLADLGVWLALLPLIVIGGRGGLQGKSLNIVNAFHSGSVAEGYLTLNGPFSAIHSGRQTAAEAHEFLPRDEAVEIARSRLGSESTVWSAAGYPLQRRSPSPLLESGAANVVIVVLESWDALVTDSLRVRAGLEPLGITPSFDALVPEGLLFTRFYASGQRSIEGMAALLAGVPTIPGLPYLGAGMEQSRLSYLGQMAKAHGLNTFFVRSAKRFSFRLDGVAPLAGFDYFAGAEDILPTGSHTSEPTNFWGAWDYDSLRFFHERLRDSGGPFLGFFFGSSTSMRRRPVSSRVAR